MDGGSRETRAGAVLAAGALCACIASLASRLAASILSAMSMVLLAGRYSLDDFKNALQRGKINFPCSPHAPLLNSTMLDKAT